MTKNNKLLLVFLLALIGIYIFFFTSWFKTKTVRIYSFVPPIQAPNPRRDVPIFFGLIGQFRLTEVKVVPLAAFEKDPATPPLWHLISDSNSVPVEKFRYGQHIHGMRPPVRGEQPEDLQTNVMYRLIVVAGHIRGVHDFELK